ncbi:MAG: hypothetical protein HYR94_21090, partial [Chloroflexi bacterium]|nr:hypothetical protein [Chloroflexota bacterium]
LAEALATSEPKSSRWPIYTGVGLAAVLIVIALAGFWLPGFGLPIFGSDQAVPPFLAGSEATATPAGSQENISATPPTSQAEVFAPPPVTLTATVIISTPTPAPTATEPPATPVPPPAALADSQRDFSGSQNTTNWEYQWSKGRDSFDWVQMQFDGTCWRAPKIENHVWEDYVRICANSAHPGAEGDVAWRWQSDLSGPVEVQVSAQKIDTQGGDGVIILVYRNTAEIKRWQLGADDSSGFADQLNLDVVQGDYLFFVIKASTDATNDETALRVQIFRQP